MSQKEPLAGNLTHLNAEGEAHMVDISAKAESVREATAEARIHMSEDAFRAIQEGGAPKGDVLAAARLAGIMAAKKTSDLIPLCHPLPLTKVTLDVQPLTDSPGYRLVANCRTRGQTGVEMEALTAVSVATLTLYDMAKALDKAMLIDGVRLLLKTGGKSGDYRAES